MNKKINIISIIVLCVLSIALLSLNITLALFSDRIDTSGIVQFKQHKLDIEIVDNDSVVLSKEELTIGSLATREINIKNPANSTSCVFRIWLEFYVEGTINNEYLSLNMDETDFIKGDNNKYYYSRVLSSGGNISNIILTFKVNEEIDSTNFAGKNYDLKLCIESIQSTKIAVQTEWQNDYPASWYESAGIKNNLT